jgi:hypothetical protein
MTTTDDHARGRNSAIGVCVGLGEDLAATPGGVQTNRRADMASTRGASDEWTTVAAQRVSRWSLWLAAFASVAMVAAIVAEGELGLFDPPASVNLWVGLAPGVAWLGAGLVHGACGR